MKRTHSTTSSQSHYDISEQDVYEDIDETEYEKVDKERSLAVVNKESVAEQDTSSKSATKRNLKCKLEVSAGIAISSAIIVILLALITLVITSVELDALNNLQGKVFFTFALKFNHTAN